MSAGEGLSIASVVLALVVQIAVSLGLRAWGLRVARRHGGAAWRRAAWMPIVALALALGGTAVSMAMLVRAFGAVASVAPSERAQVLSSRIADAMVATAVTVVPSWALYGASFVAFLVGTVRKPRDATPTA